MRVGITGAFGQFGFHLRCRLFVEKDMEVVSVGHEAFADDVRLRDFVSGLDAIVHLAGVNRASEDEVAAANPAIARRLIDALARAKASPHLLYASTTHVDGDTVYGRSKREADRILAAWAEANGAAFSAFVFPHLFGEFGRPHYNSAATTFAWQIANGEAPSVTGNGQVELLHFGDAANLIVEALRSGGGGERRPEGRKLSVSEMAERLQRLATSYVNHVVPDLRDPLDLRLFNVYRSFLYPGHYPVRLSTHADDRGALTETVKSLNGGQSFFSTTRPGVTRGNHFHVHKVERFVVLKGRARISIRRMFDEAIDDFFVSGDALCYIDMPTLCTHAISNIGEEELVTLFWAHEIFDPNNPDTVPEPIRRP